ncbi:MAG: Histone-lysine N-methyltransferase, H3 lysine-36 and H4 lysine-20 specific, variant 2 [Marteilia pararefringens]
MKSVNLALELLKIENYARIIEIRNKSKFIDNLFNEDLSLLANISIASQYESDNESYDSEGCITVSKQSKRSQKPKSNGIAHTNNHENSTHSLKLPFFRNSQDISHLSESTKLMLQDRFSQIAQLGQTLNLYTHQSTKMNGNSNRQTNGTLIADKQSRSASNQPKLIDSVMMQSIDKAATDEDCIKQILPETPELTDICTPIRPKIDSNRGPSGNNYLQTLTPKNFPTHSRKRNDLNFETIIGIYDSFSRESTTNTNDSPAIQNNSSQEYAEASSTNTSHISNDASSSTADENSQNSSSVFNKFHMFCMRKRTTSIPNYSNSISMSLIPQERQKKKKSTIKSRKVNHSDKNLSEKDDTDLVPGSAPSPTSNDYAPKREKLCSTSSSGSDCSISQASVLNYKSNPLGFKSMAQCMINNYTVNYSSQICSYCFKEIKTSKITAKSANNNHVDPQLDHFSCAECNYCWHTNCYKEMINAIGVPGQKVEESKYDDSRCRFCADNKQRCIVCNVYDVDLLRCNKANCQSYIHEGCIDAYPLGDKSKDGFRCPHHYCLSCFKTYPENIKKQCNGQLLKCVLCPLACHASDFCIPAGTICLGTTQYIICHRHIKPLLIKQRVSANFCFSCTESDNLIKCSQCPTCFHPDCIGIDYSKIKDKSRWRCEECENIKLVKYGQVVWTKFRNYPWWPGQVVHERYASKKIQNIAHTVGQFVVHFFGTNEFIWTHIGKVYLYTDGDEGEDAKIGKNLMAKFNEALLDADIAYQIYNTVIQGHNMNNPMDTFKMIKSNQPVGSVIIRKEKGSTIPLCDCEPLPGACSDDTCINRRMKFECSANKCLAKDFCQNLNFTQRNYPKSVVFKTEDRGFGLKTLEFIKEGDFVNEYLGDLIDHKELKKRQKFDHDNNIHNFYYLTLDSSRTIDARLKSNLSRFINHSCSPNLVATKWMVNGDLRIGFFALHDIESNTELSFDYNFTSINPNYLECLCKAENCRKYFGNNKENSNKKSKS